MKHNSAPIDPKDPVESPAFMFKLIGSIGLILLGGLFAGEYKAKKKEAGTCVKDDVLCESIVLMCARRADDNGLTLMQDLRWH